MTVVGELFGVVVANRASGGVVVTSGIFSRSSTQRLYDASGGSIMERNLLTGKLRSLAYEGSVPSMCIDPGTRTAYLVDPDGNAIRQLRLR